MIKKITLSGKAGLLLFLILTSGFNSKIYAQCAGEDATLDVCDKSTQQFVDLFGALGGSPQPGGVWADNDNTGGLDTETGELNTWRVNMGGVFTYTYTNADCGESATVTLNLAGFPGRDDPNAVACDDNSRVNLFQFTGGSPAATIPGDWSIVAVNNDKGDSVNSANAYLSNRFFNAAQAGTGSYTFTYTITDQVSQNCNTATNTPKLSSTVTLEVSPAPDSGENDPTVTTIFCETDDLSGLTAFDLRAALIDEDEGGYWIENGTNELDNATDSTINIQRLRDNFGAGVYSFTYVVEPINQICNESRTTVSITFEKVADFTSASLELDFPTEEEDLICEDTLPTYTTDATITGDPALIPDGDYEVTYTVSPNPNSGSETLTVSMTNGVGTFTVNPEFFKAAGVAELRINRISDPNTVGVCDSKIGDLSDTLTIVALPDLSDTAISVEQPLCFGENGSLLIDDSGTTTQFELADGDYSFSYTLATANASSDYKQTATVNNGSAILTLPANVLATVEDYTLTLTAVENQNGCVTTASLTTSFTVDPLPDAQTVSVSIEDTCEGNPVTVIITDSSDPANLSDGIYDFTYTITGSFTLTNEVAKAVNITDGSGSFTLPAASLANGASNLTLTAIANTTTQCSTANFSNPSASFTIIQTPDLTQSTLSIQDTCEDSGVAVSLSTDPSDVPDGNYKLTYTLSNAGNASETTLALNFTNGEATFALTAEQLANAGNYNLEVTAVTTENQDCPAAGLPVSASFNVNPLPVIESANLTVADICFEESASIEITGTNLSDGTYEVTYEVSDANTFSATENLNFVAGEASITLDDTQLTNAGSTTFKITQVVDLSTACTSTAEAVVSFNVNPIPDVVAGQISASDICLNEMGLISFTGASGLADGTYDITYDLTGANTASDLPGTFVITNGAGIYEIPATYLTNIGSTNFTLTLITSETGCTSDPLTVSDDFEVLALPDASGLTVTATDVCFGENVSVALSGATALADADYEVSYQLSGSNITEAFTERLNFTGGAASLTLDSSVLINSGTTNFTVTDVQNITTFCSAANLGTVSTSFVLEDPTVPSLASDDNIFCINDTPTVGDLESRIDSSFEILTYNSETGGSVLASTTLLTDNTSYYIAAINTTTGCEGSQRLEVIADLSGCESLFIPNGFSPNGDGLNDVFEIKNIGIVYPDYTIEVFNRNGSVVFKGNASTGFWDGRANTNNLGGNTLPNGVYFYIINYNDGQTKSRQGNVYLNR